ncbi:hypothetical protein [Bradyrhizobium elkanii]|uniref:hypothetical protein n=1 Tax=Bradyrhizobium elkanii TaxID=29448 RepID=UPI002226E4BF|nr:hypothetical protein [Bradyrhizobium elkanii]MCW2130779.1 hypothetical protein [Bradyrhizobium elkanii]MCW2175935.1 hypothetical protein [Bradyrhizobium elkanii]
MDSELGRPWAGSSLMIHGNWVDPDIGMAIARGLKAHRFRLADSDPRVLLRWADRSYGFSSHRPRTILPHAQPSRNQNRSALQHYALADPADETARSSTSVVRVRPGYTTFRFGAAMTPGVAQWDLAPAEGQEAIRLAKPAPGARHPVWV